MLQLRGDGLFAEMAVIVPSFVSTPLLWLLYFLTCLLWWLASRKILQLGGAWVAQLVKCPTSAQVMISWFVGSSPASGSVSYTKSASDPVSLSLCPSPTHALSLSPSQK